MDANSATRWLEVSELATVQHGRVTLGQIRDRGLGRGAVEKAVRSGRLHREHDGVFVLGHRAATPHGRWMAAVLACGPSAVLSHRSAAALWGLHRRELARVDVTIPTGSHRERPGIEIHRAKLPAAERTTWQGIPSTTPARILVDLAHDLDDRELARLLREMQFQRRFDLDAVLRATSGGRAGASGASSRTSYWRPRRSKTTSSP